MEPDKLNNQHVSIIFKTLFLQYTIVIYKHPLARDHNPQVYRPLLKDAPTPWFLPVPTNKDIPIP